jgi:SAM-dependent methyltransferase
MHAVPGRDEAVTREMRNRLTLAQLAIRDEDKVLEIGCGNGLGVSLASEMVSAGLVAGIDIAPERTKRARRLNAQAIGEGRVVIKTACITRKRPFKLLVFDKAFLVNSIHLWANPLQGLINIREQLRPGGLLAVTVPIGSGPRSKNCEAKLRSLRALLTQAGLTPVDSHCWHTSELSALCVVSRRDGAPEPGRVPCRST